MSNKHKQDINASER